MQHVFIRANAAVDLGLGHISRCRNIARVLTDNGATVSFFVDQIDEKIQSFLLNYKIMAIYSKSESFISQFDDAARFIRQMERCGVPDVVILDDYRLDVAWETEVAQKSCAKIVAIDDVRRKHSADILIDTKWAGLNTQSRYDGLTNSDCLKLLGPQYLPLGHEYQAPETTTSQSATLKVVISLGGGGSAEFLKEFCERFIEQISSTEDVSIVPVVGPYLMNQDLMHNLEFSYQKISPHYNPDGLFSILQDADLFVGAAGGSLFEALSLRIPCLSFTLAENQKNNIFDLQEVGNTFHVGFVCPPEIPKLATLAHTMLQQLERVQAICEKNRIVSIDANGCERIYQAISSLFHRTETNEPVWTYPSGDVPSGYTFDTLPDADLNYYLEARNLVNNKENMALTETITSLDHMLWWLSPNGREFFVLKQNGVPVVYVWQKCVEVTERVLIGGWFAATTMVSGVDAMNALQRQLSNTDAMFPGIRWLAVIRKTNSFTLLLNQRFNFEVIGEDDNLFHDARVHFPYANPDEFLFLARG
tara:strand:+ start:2366 stop:3964 length:1599 start_codon:yes stop_codon:yes gene_type:complete